MKLSKMIKKNEIKYNTHFFFYVQSQLHFVLLIKATTIFWYKIFTLWYFQKVDHADRKNNVDAAAAATASKAQTKSHNYNNNKMNNYFKQNNVTHGNWKKKI